MWEGKGIGKMIKGQKENSGKIVKTELLFHPDIDIDKYIFFNL